MTFPLFSCNCNFKRFPSTKRPRYSFHSLNQKESQVFSTSNNYDKFYHSKDFPLILEPQRKSKRQYQLIISTKALFPNSTNTLNRYKDPINYRIWSWFPFSQRRAGRSWNTERQFISKYKFLMNNSETYWRMNIFTSSGWMVCQKHILLPPFFLWGRGDSSSFELENVIINQVDDERHLFN